MKGLNLGLLPCRQILYQLSHQGSLVNISLTSIIIKKLKLKITIR